MTAAPAPSKTAKIALLGNPNAGKTSLFNALTGSSQRVANYPGVTVERVTGSLKVKGDSHEVIDIPGLYSLRALSEDEQVARRELAHESGISVLVYVLDATSMERGLFLFSQAAELGIPMVVALTMTDMAEKDGLKIDPKVLEEKLMAPVVPVVAHKRQGIDELVARIGDQLSAAAPSALELGFPPLVEDAAERIKEKWPNETVTRGEIRSMLLSEEGAEPFAPREMVPIFIEEQKELLGSGIQPRTLDAQTRYAWSSMVVKHAVERPGQAKSTITAKIDKFLTHRVFGLIAFLGIMYLLFFSIYTWAGPFMDLIETGVGRVAETVSPMLEGNEVMQSLVVDGIINGIGSAIVFLPQILILFLFIAILEGSGYLARASFLMDRAMGWCGLNGRAFIPLLSSFACAIPGVMAARVMPDSRSRLATIMVAPLMSCSARLPVYVLLIGTFIQPKFGAGWAAFALFMMHFVGLIVAAPVAWLLTRKFLKGKRLPFMLELPRYQWPKWKDVFLLVYTRGKIFLKTAGTIIFVMSIVIWALLYFPRSAEAEQRYEAEYAQKVDPPMTQENYVIERQREESYLGQFGRALEPAFRPAGFDWRLTTAILAAFPAREVVVPAMGILFSIGDEADEESTDLREAMVNATWPDGRPLLTIWNAIGLMVFFALCMQCMATLAAMKRETGGWKWPLIGFGYMTALAYLGAVLLNTLGKIFGT